MQRSYMAVDGEMPALSERGLLLYSLVGLYRALVARRRCYQHMVFTSINLVEPETICLFAASVCRVYRHSLLTAPLPSQ